MTRGEQGRPAAAAPASGARDVSDTALAEACRRGDQGAFDTLVHRYKDRLYNLAYRYLGNREEALDLCQEVFIRAYRGLDGFQGTSQLYTWLHAIAVNLARNRLRDQTRKGRNQGVSLDALTAVGGEGVHPAAGAGPRSEAQSHELDEILQQCLDELPEVCRLAFVLRTVEGLSYEAIAEALECPKGTVKSRLNQARTLLRERLGALGVL
ncbi:MAG: sigma-70 family RNA polymerase sigma factor [Candidatus Hydrogenedentota bacterium]